MNEPRIISPTEARQRLDTTERSSIGDSIFREMTYTAAVQGERVEAVLKLTYASDDGTEYEHDHGPLDGFPECPACWVSDIRRVLGVTE